MKGLRAGLGAAAVALTVIGADYGAWRTAEGDRLRRRSRIVHTARGDVEVVDEGTGRPVLMLHGSPGGYDAGPLFASMLGLGGWRIISPSRPGYLRTPSSSGRAPQEQADLMIALLDALQVEDASVVGISGGGPCALALADKHSERCTRLVMIEALSDSYSEHSMYAALPPVARLGKWTSTALMKSNAPAYLARWAGRFEESGMVTELAHSFARYDLRRQGYELDMSQFEALGPMPVDRVTMPTLIAHGDEDTDVPVAQARELAARIPQSRLVIAQGCNHMSLWSSPRLGAEVRDFLTAGDDED